MCVLTCCTEADACIQHAICIWLMVRVLGCRLAQDNTLLVTTASCGGVLLAANWIKTLQALQVPPCKT